MLDAILRQALGKHPPTDRQLSYLIELPEERLPELLAAARQVRRAFFGRSIGLCAIVNARSGRCAADCAFCAQSARHATDVPSYPFIGAQKVAEAAARARAAGATRFGIVTSGERPGRSEFAELCRAVAGVAALGLAADVSAGFLEPGDVARLQAAGLSGVHHNLETARSFFPRICTTHDYDTALDTVRSALAAGAQVCSGGIFGLGEGWDARIELAETLRGLGVASVPINFLTPIPGTPLAGRPAMARAEALRLVALYRFMLPEAHLRICGGRPLVFADDPLEVLTAGASGLMTGDYLTTPGERPESDLMGLQKLGYEAG
jgi:biotin synthase